MNAPSGSSGDAGLGASVAIGPDDQPRIASVVIERADTGSPQSAQLLFDTRTASGTWTKETVASSAAGYTAGDGDKGTGFAPYLRYDASGTPHIAFSDFASQHFWFGADEFAGQIRHAKKAGASWAIQTVFAQTDPLRNMVHYPVLAVSSNLLFFAGLQRTDSLNSDLVITTVDLEQRWPCPLDSAGRCQPRRPPRGRKRDDFRRPGNMARNQPAGSRDPDILVENVVRVLLRLPGFFHQRRARHRYHRPGRLATGEPDAQLRNPGAALALHEGRYGQFRPGPGVGGSGQLHAPEWAPDDLREGRRLWHALQPFWVQCQRRARAHGGRRGLDQPFDLAVPADEHAEQRVVLLHRSGGWGRSTAVLPRAAMKRPDIFLKAHHWFFLCVHWRGFAAELNNADRDSFLRDGDSGAAWPAEPVFLPSMPMEGVGREFPGGAGRGPIGHLHFCRYRASRAGGTITPFSQ